VNGGGEKCFGNQDAPRRSKGTCFSDLVLKKRSDGRFLFSSFSLHGWGREFNDVFS
jgi:hypothetical protein